MRRESPPDQAQAWLVLYRFHIIVTFLEHLQSRRLLLPCLAQFAGESCDLCVFAQSGKTPIAGGLWCG